MVTEYDKKIFLLNTNPEYQFLNSNKNWDLFDDISKMSPAPIRNYKKIDIFFEKYDLGKKLKADPDYSNALQVNIFSEKAIKTLKTFLKKNVELLKVNNLTSDKEYSLFNFIRNIDCLDKDKSNIRDNGYGSIIEIKKYEFIYEVIKNEDFFAIKGASSYAYVSDKFVKVVIDTKLTGFRFQPLWSLEKGGVEYPTYSAIAGVDRTQDWIFT